MNWAQFFHAVQGIFTFVLIGSLGFYLSRRNWFAKESAALLTRLTNNVAIPFLLFYHLDASFSRSDLEKLLHGGMLPFISILSAIGIALILTRLLRVSRDRRGIFVTSFAFSNTLNIGIPINLALFGGEAIPHVLLYYLGSTVLFWSIGYYLLMRGMKPEETGSPLRGRLKNLLSPPMIAVLISLTLLCIGVRLPAVVSEASRHTRHIGGMVTPLVMISIGIILSRMSLGQMKAGLDTWLIVAGRFVVCPLMIVLLSRFFDLPPLMRNVFIIQSSLPSMTTIPMLCQHHNGDAEYATKNVTLTTLLAIGTVPLFMMLMNS